MKKLLLVLVLFATTTIYAQSYNQGFRDGWLNVNNGIGVPSVPFPKIGRTTYKDGFADGAAAGAKAGNSGSNRSNMKADDWAKVYGAGNYSSQSEKIGNSVNNAINENRQRRQYSNNNSYSDNSSSGIDYTYSNSATAKFGAKDYEGAIRDYSNHIQKYPNSPDEWFLRGVSKYRLDIFGGACFDFKKSADLGLEEAQSWLLVHCNLDGSYKKSARDFNEEGAAKYRLKDYSGAIADFTKAIELDPGDDTYYNNRGFSKYSVGDLNGACKDWRKATSLGHPDSAKQVRKFCNENQTPSSNTEINRSGSINDRAKEIARKFDENKSSSKNYSAYLETGNYTLYSEASSKSEVLHKIKGGIYYRVIKKGLSFYLIETDNGEKGYILIYSLRK